MVISLWIMHTLWRTDISCRGAPLIVLFQEADGEPLGPNTKMLKDVRLGREGRGDGRIAKAGD